MKANRFTDSSNNNNIASTEFNWTYDSIAPNVTIAATNSAGTSITSGSTTKDDSVFFAVAMNESIANFDQNDVTITNGQIASFTPVSSTVYNIVFIPGDGVNTLEIAAGAFTDAAGNNNQSSDRFSWAYDGVKPSVVIAASNDSGQVASGSLSNDATLKITFTLSEATSNFSQADVALIGGTLSAFVGVSDTVYTRYSPQHLMAMLRFELMQMFLQIFLEMAIQQATPTSGPMMEQRLWSVLQLQMKIISH